MKENIRNKIKQNKKELNFYDFCKPPQEDVDYVLRVSIIFMYNIVDIPRNNNATYAMCLPPDTATHNHNHYYFGFLFFPFLFFLLFFFVFVVFAYFSFAIFREPI